MGYSMGERGPNPKSRAQRKLSGNSSRRPLPSVQDAAPINAPVSLHCPDWMSDDAKAYWEKIVPQLVADGTVDDRDWSALVTLCEAWGDFQDAARTLKTTPRYYTTPNGAECVHPAVRQKATAMKTLSSFMEKFGLQPTTRQRLPMVMPAGVAAEKDSYTEFRERG